MQEIQRMTTRQRQEQQTGTYRELIGLAEDNVTSTILAATRMKRIVDPDLERQTPGIVTLS
jgi:IS5 family transposase